MKINIRLAPLEKGKWHWAIGRAGVMTTSGHASSYEKAQRAAEEAARGYAEEAEKAHFYLYDTDTQGRIEHNKG